MVGSAVWRALTAAGYTNLMGRSSKELDLRNQAEVNTFFAQEKPGVVIDAAAKVGGILANNTYPYAFLMDNLQIQNNLIAAALQTDVQKFIFLGSSCIYPKLAPQPLKEEYLLTGPLEPTNEWYAIAKIAGVKACEAIRKEFGKDYVSLMPTNLYGPFDNFDLQSSHVLPAMIRKFHEAKHNNHASVTRHTHARVLTRRRPRSGGFVCFSAHLTRAPLQRGLRHRPHHQRTGLTHSKRSGPRRRNCLGRLQTRRHTTQAHGRQ